MPRSAARGTRAICAALLTLILPGALGQIGAIALCALAGLWLLRLPHQGAVVHPSYGVSRRAGASMR